MSHQNSKLTSLALSIFQSKVNNNYPTPKWFQLFPPYDVILRTAQNLAYILHESHPEIDEVMKEAFSGPYLSPLAPIPNQLDPMVFHSWGGTRISSKSFIFGIISAALLKMFFYRLPLEDDLFITLVLEGYNELVRASKGEQVNCLAINGVACVSLVEGEKVSTPWGVLYPAMTDNKFSDIAFIPDRPSASCVLIRPCLTYVSFDRAPQPVSKIATTDESPKNVRNLLPLACVLASPNSKNPIVPIVTWSTFLLPFCNSFSYSFPFLPPIMKPVIDISPVSHEIEKWSSIIHECHTSTIDIAVNRLTQALSYRLDKADILIDSVMAWENLLGTSTEVAFRVTAALSKLLEPDIKQRQLLRKSLEKIYNLRSRVIHGSTVDSSEIDKYATEAVAYSLNALRASYKRGKEWLNLSSQNRADKLILEEP